VLVLAWGPESSLPAVGMVTAEGEREREGVALMVLLRSRGEERLVVLVRSKFEV
jgi:hypothetical protein